MIKRMYVASCQVIQGPLHGLVEPAVLVFRLEKATGCTAYTSRLGASSTSNDVFVSPATARHAHTTPHAYVYKGQAAEARLATAVLHHVVSHA
jgi:hypothetical protein